VDGTISLAEAAALAEKIQTLSSREAVELILVLSDLGRPDVQELDPRVRDWTIDLLRRQAREAEYRNLERVQS
jgi:hypothetical protein